MSANTDFESELEAQFRIYKALQPFDHARRDSLIRAVMDRLARERAPAPKLVEVPHVAD